MIFRGDAKRELWRCYLDASVISVAATANCSIIAAATVGRHLHLLNREGESVWTSPKRLDHEGWCVALSRNANVIAVGTAAKNPRGGSIYAFDFQGHQVLNYTVGAPVWGVDVSPDGGEIIAASWNNKVYRFARKGQRYSRIPTVTSTEADKGLYCIRFLPGTTDSVAAAYDHGLIVVGKDGQTKDVIPCNTGLYNLSVARDSNEIFAGGRDGIFINKDLSLDTHSFRSSSCVASRPLCGVSATPNGQMLFVGSFDGSAYLVDRAGKTLWSVETDGEVWSTACSTDATLVCLGSGDNSVRLYENFCSTSAYEEIEAVEMELSKGLGVDTAANLKLLVSLYMKYGLAKYGHEQMRHLSEGVQDSFPYDDAREELLNQVSRRDPDNQWSHFELGKLWKERSDFYQAAYHFQQAARSSELYSQAMNLSAEAFSGLQLKTATSSCFRRAREQHLNGDALRVLYNIGRSYEDGKQWREALSCYELLVSWDAKYRNTWERLQNVRAILGSGTVEIAPSLTDYTGLTTSLLGPDTPRDVDHMLQGVIAARTAEVLLQPGERR